VFILFYAFVVAPLSFVANVLASMPVTAITTAASDIQLQLGDDVISIRDVVAKNAVAIKTYSIAFSSLAVRMTIELIASFRKEPRTGGEQAGVSWATRHARLVRLAGVQGLLGLFVFTLLVVAILLPSLIDAPPEATPPIGETIGAEVLMGLSVWAVVAMVLKIRRYRKRVALPLAATTA
jgi:hypothetical protein